MSEKLNDTIRVRAGESLKKRGERLAEVLSKRQPAGSRKITLADVTRMALAQYVADNDKAKVSSKDNGK